MPVRPVLVIVIATWLVGLDGFDVFSISFASPAIADEWGIGRAELGLVLSLEMVGMGVGGYVLGWFADRVGRRPALLLCLTLVASGMWLASVADNIAMLSIVRVYTGLGIGGMLATCNALVSESSHDRYRNLAVAMMISGFPLGTAIGGTFAGQLLAATGQWQSIFQLGAAVTAASLLLVLCFVPETIPYLRQRQHRLESAEGQPPGALFEPVAIRIALPLTFAFFMHMMTYYFLMKWIPKIVADLGHAASDAGLVLVWANVGGVLGSVALSLLTRLTKVRALVAGALACGGLAVCVFGRYVESLTELSLAAAGAGFFTTGATAGLYAMFAQAFPTQLRASGTGLVIGFGRGGAALGPVCAGILFSMDWPLLWVAPVLACGSLAAAAIIALASPRQLPDRGGSGSELNAG